MDGKFTANKNFKMIWLVAFLLVIISGLLLFSCFKEIFTGGHIFNGHHYDFIAFYSAANLSLHGHISQIYDQSALSQLQLQYVNHPVGAAGYMPFMNPPLFALLISPLALISITSARILWLFTSLILLVVTVYTITKPLPKWQRLASVAVLIGTFPMFQALVEGQPSILILFSGLLAYLFARQKQLMWCGIFLTPLFIKPQIAIFGLLIMKQWRVLAGMLASALAVSIAALPVTGIKIYGTYLKYLIESIGGHFLGAGATVPTVWKGSIGNMASINGFFVALLGQNRVTLVNLLTLLVVIIGLSLFVLAFRKVKFGLTHKNEVLMLTASIILALLINPHFYAQDVILIYLILPLLFIYSLKNRFTILLLVAAICNLLYLDDKIHLHLFTLLAFGLCMVIFIKFSRLHPIKI